MEEASQPVQQQNSVQASQEPVKRNFHWIYIFIVVFTLLIISAVFYLGRLSSGQSQQISVSPTPQISKPTDETANWKTYENTDYKFTFRYPQDWVLNIPSLAGKDETNKTVFQLNLSNTENFKNKALLGENRDVVNFTVLVWAMGNQSYDQAVNSWYAFEQNPNPPDKVYTKEINQISWKVEEITFPTNTKLSGYIFPKNDYLYIIEVSPRNSNIIDTTTQILSTFKFTDQNQTANIIPTDQNLKTFSSKNLGISFTYLEKQGEELITVKEIGSKIYVYSTKTQPTTGQSIEVFQKEKTETLEQAIKRKFLTGYSEKDCFVSKDYPYAKSNYPGNYEAAIISFPKSTDPNSIGFENASKCPNGYTTAGGNAYFLMDKNHPDKFFYFSIGQYQIDSANNKGWQETIQILN